MKRRLITRAVLAALCAAGCSKGHAAPNLDNEVAHTMQAYINAWNRADAEAIASQFVENADFVNPTGFYAQGRPAIRAFYAQAFSAGYAGSHGSFTPTTARLVAPGVLLLDGAWIIAGARTPSGALRTDEHGTATAILVKKGPEWLLAALRER